MGDLDDDSWTYPGSAWSLDHGGIQNYLAAQFMTDVLPFRAEQLGFGLSEAGARKIGLDRKKAPLQARICLGGSA